MLKVGKLYSCEYYLILYPNKESAAVGGMDALSAFATEASTFWSERLGGAVSYAEKNIPILALNNKGIYTEIRAGDKTGWIINQDLNFKEIEQCLK